MIRSALAALALLALLATPSRAGEELPCDAHFLVQGDPLLGDEPEVLDVEPDGVSIVGHCGRKQGRVRIEPEGARLRVGFSTFCPPDHLCIGSSFLPVFIVGPRRISLCSGMKGVRLQATLDPSCETLTGRLRARRPRIDREFVAVVSPLVPPDCVPNATGVQCGCGSLFGIACTEDAFCDAGNSCSEEGRIGQCIPVPEQCPDVVQPVCGCDGVTYGNDCERRGARASKAHDGPCEPAE